MKKLFEKVLIIMKVVLWICGIFLFSLVIFFKLVDFFFFNLLLFPLRVFYYLIYLYYKFIKMESKKNDRSWKYNKFKDDTWLLKYWRNAYEYDNPPFTYSQITKRALTTRGALYNLKEIYIKGLRNVMRLHLKERLDALEKDEKVEDLFKNGKKLLTDKMSFDLVLKQFVYDFYYVENLSFWSIFISEENLERFVLDNVYVELYSSVCETDESFVEFFDDMYEVTDEGGLDIILGYKMSWEQPGIVMPWENWDFDNRMHQNIIRPGFKRLESSIFRQYYKKFKNRIKSIWLFFFGNILYYLYYCKWFCLNYVEYVKYFFFYYIWVFNINFVSVELVNNLVTKFNLNKNILNIKKYTYKLKVGDNFLYKNKYFDFVYEYLICISILLNLNLLVRFIINCFSIVIRSVCVFSYIIILKFFVAKYYGFLIFKSTTFFEIILYLNCFIILKKKYKIKFLLSLPKLIKSILKKKLYGWYEIIKTLIFKGSQN